MSHCYDVLFNCWYYNIFLLVRVLKNHAVVIHSVIISIDRSSKVLQNSKIQFLTVYNAELELLNIYTSNTNCKIFCFSKFQFVSKQR